MIFLLLSILTPPHGTLSEREKIRNSLHNRSSTDVPFTPPRGTGQNISPHPSLGPRPIFFFYATPWHRAEVLDALLNRSSTDCFLIPPRGTEQQSSTHCSNGPRHQVARQTKPNTTVRLKWTLIETSRLTPLSRDKHEKVQTTQIISSVLNQNQKQLPNIWQPPIHKDKQRKKTKRVQKQKT